MHPTSPKESGTMDDLQAIQRLKAGDIGGLETLVERYPTKAVRTAFPIIHIA